MAPEPAAEEGPVGKALAVLALVAERRRGVAVAEVAGALALTVPTAHRIAAGLVEAGWLQRGLGSKRLVVGPRLVALSFHAMAATFGDGARHAVMQELADELGEQVELGAVRGGQVVYFATARSVRPASLQFEPGRRAPLHCTSTGKLFLAELSPAARTRIVRTLPLTQHTARTITDPDLLLQHLAEVRANGFATTIEEFVEGVAGCAVPVRDARGEMVAALGITAPLTRLREAGPARHVPALRRAAGQLGATFADDPACHHPEELIP